VVSCDVIWPLRAESALDRLPKTGITTASSPVTSAGHEICGGDNSSTIKNDANPTAARTDHEAVS